MTPESTLLRTINFGFGVKLSAFGSWKSGPKMRVERDRRKLRDRFGGLVLVALGVAHVARCRRGQALESGRAADLIGDRDVERLTRKIAVALRRDARTADDPARRVAQERTIVAERGEIRQQVHVLLDRLEGERLFLQVVVGADLVRDEDLLLHAEAPEPGSETYRHLFSVGHGVAVAVEENIEQRQSDRHSASAEHAA